MKARSRYLILCLCLVFTLIFVWHVVKCLLIRSNRHPDPAPVHIVATETKHSYLDESGLGNLVSYLDLHVQPPNNDGSTDNGSNPQDQAHVAQVNIWKQISLGSVPNFNVNGKKKIRFAANCRLWNCFDFRRCAVNDRLRVHIYPPLTPDRNDLSETFVRILRAIIKSPYYEPDAERACVFVPSIDLLDRDPLSADFRPHVPRSFAKYEGKNHLMFNFYSGSWPSYDELDFAGFDPGYAILVKASFGVRHFRPGFDISYPLYSRLHPFHEPIPDTLNSNANGNNPSVSASGSAANANINDNTNNINNGNKEYAYWSEFRILDQRNMTIETENKHLLVFKGTRYVTGQGSDVRDALPLLHNGDDIHMLTTCRKSRSPADQRCSLTSVDEQTYLHTDYERLMRNSTFCLVPRGRRLGSFRFLEALRANCIPVLLSGDWLLPLHDVLDWHQAVIKPDQRTLLRVPDLLRSIGWLRVQRMRAVGARLYHTYFSSVQQTVLSVLHLLEQRIHSQLATRSFLWTGRIPLASFLTAHSPGQTCERDMPKFRSRPPTDCNQSPSALVNNVSNKFTALVYVSQPLALRLLLRLLRNLIKANHLHQTVVIWSLPVDPPNSLLFDHRPARTILIRSTDRFPMQYIQTDCILTLDSDSSLLPEELDFAFRAWQTMPNRLLGFSARAHVFDEHRSRFVYSSRWANEFSIILLDAAFFHRWYAIAFTRHLTLNANESNVDPWWLDERNSSLWRAKDSSTAASSTSASATLGVCTDLHFNFLFALLSRQPPVKLTQRKRTSAGPAPLPVPSGSDAFGASQRCFELLSNHTFARIPLRNSQARFDPLLFKDPVSTLRKRYRRIEQVL